MWPEHGPGCCVYLGKNKNILKKTIFVQHMHEINNHTHVFSLLVRALPFT